MSAASMPSPVMPNPVPFVCLAIGDEQMDVYTTRLYRMLSRHVSVPFTLLCYSDRPRQLPPEIEVRDCSDWNEVTRAGMRVTTKKLRIFDNVTVPYEEFFYLDLTLVIRQDMSDLLKYAFGRPEALVVVQDWAYPVYNSCVMRIRRGPLREVYDAFVRGEAYPHRIAGDQDFLSACIEAKNLKSHVAVFRPHDVVSYKVARGLNRTNRDEAYAMLDSATIVKFHGKPKPHQILDPAYRFTRIWLRNRRDASFWRRELQSHWGSL